MTSIITGDIIKSGTFKHPNTWLDILKTSLSYLNNNGNYWELYRGDGFQIEIKDIFKSFEAVIYIKASLKCNKQLDARFSIGIGEKSFTGETISESNGEVFQFSGATLEQLKKEKVNLKIKTQNSELDKELNLYFKLALVIMDNWSPKTAEIVKLYLENPDSKQDDLGKIAGITQNTVSERQKRAYLSEILELNALYKEKISTLLS